LIGFGGTEWYAPAHQRTVKMKLDVEATAKASTTKETYDLIDYVPAQ
jgi:hypothetical protein